MVGRLEPGEGEGRDQDGNRGGMEGGVGDFGGLVRSRSRGKLIHYICFRAHMYTY